MPDASIQTEPQQSLTPILGRRFAGVRHPPEPGEDPDTPDTFRERVSP
jgi:hypothetical protein